MSAPQSSNACRNQLYLESTKRRAKELHIARSPINETRYYTFLFNPSLS